MDTLNNIEKFQLHKLGFLTFLFYFIGNYIFHITPISMLHTHTPSLLYLMHILSVYLSYAKFKCFY